MRKDEMHHISKNEYGYNVRVHYCNRKYHRFFKTLEEAKAQRDSWLAQVKELKAKARGELK